MGTPDHSVQAHSARGESYDVFLSYSRQNAEQIVEIRNALEKADISVFDPHTHFADLWGQTLESYVQELFPARASNAMLFISHEYVDSLACRHEMELIAARAAAADAVSSVLPVKLDDTPMPTALNGVIFVEMSTASPETLANLTKEAIQRQRSRATESLASLSDELLLEKIARERDESAFAVVHERWAPILYRIGRKQCPADFDLVQEALAKTLFKLWQRAQWLADHRVSLKKYLPAMFLSAISDQLKSERALSLRRDDTTPSQVDGLPEAIADEALASRAVERQFVESRVEEALGELPVMERTLVEAFYINGDTVSAIAERFHLPESTVYRLKHRALRQLRNAISHADR